VERHDRKRKKTRKVDAQQIKPVNRSASQDLAVKPVNRNVSQDLAAKKEKMEDKSNDAANQNFSQDQAVEEENEEDESNGAVNQNGTQVSAVKEEVNSNNAVNRSRRQELNEAEEIQDKAAEASQQLEVNGEKRTHKGRKETESKKSKRARRARAEARRTATRRSNDNLASSQKPERKHRAGRERVRAIPPPPADDSTGRAGTRQHTENENPCSSSNCSSGQDLGTQASKEEGGESRRVKDGPWREENAPVIRKIRPWPNQQGNHDQETKGNKSAGRSTDNLASSQKQGRKHQARGERGRAIPTPPADDSTGRAGTRQLTESKTPFGSRNCSPPADDSTGRASTRKHTESKTTFSSGNCSTGKDLETQGNVSATRRRPERKQQASEERGRAKQTPPVHVSTGLSVQRMEGTSLRPPPQGEAALAVQVMEGERKQTLTNDAKSIKNQARAARRTDEQSIEETLVSIILGVGGVFQLLNSPHRLGDPSRVATDRRSRGETLFAMIPGVGGFWQLFSSPHLYGPISTALRHLGKRDTSTIQLTRTPEEWTIQQTKTPERNTTQTEEWNRIHSGTCETHRDCADISFCSEDHTCLPQGKFIMGCIAVVIIIGSGITACIWCPVPGRMGREDRTSDATSQEKQHQIMKGEQELKNQPTSNRA
jgi:hypothetical protein